MKSRPFVAVTLDDGYADNLKTALPILAEAGVPATVFVTVNNMETGSPYWWDLLSVALLREELPAQGVELEIAGRAWTHDLTTFAARQEAHRELQQILTGLPGIEIEEVVTEVASQLGVGLRAASVDGVPMTRDEVSRLSESPWIEIGSHGLSHCDLTAIGRSDVDAEAVGAKQVLEQVAGRSVLSFSYPFGFCDEVVQAAVVAAGYDVACSVGGGAVRAASDRHRYGRLLVRDWPASALESAMHRYLST